MTAPRLTCQRLVLRATDYQGQMLDPPGMREKCGYEADSYPELRAHMEASHGRGTR